jgi:hypothetical protein
VASRAINWKDYRQIQTSLVSSHYVSIRLDGLKKITKNLGQDNQRPGRYSNRVPHRKSQKHLPPDPTCWIVAVTLRLVYGSAWFESLPGCRLYLLISFVVFLMISLLPSLLLYTAMVIYLCVVWDIGRINNTTAAPNTTLFYLLAV